MDISSYDVIQKINNLDTSH